MIPSFGIPIPNLKEDFPSSEIPIDPGGNYRYGYRLNATDQTVSVIDFGDANGYGAVITTITLSSSKSFKSLFYRSLDRSVWVIGNNYYDRIDADPLSGTFNTIVQSGATVLGVHPENVSYITWPFDIVTCAAGSFRWLPMDLINESSNSQKLWNWRSRDGGVKGLITLGHDPGRNSILHPRSRIVESSHDSGITIRFAKVLDRSKKLDFNSQYILSPIYHASDLSQSLVASYMFGNFTLTNTGGAIFLQHNDYSYSPLPSSIDGIGTNINSNGPYFCEYDPVAKRIIWGSKYSVPTGYITAVQDIGYRTVTNVGALNRTAYKASGEDVTDDIIYCPYNGLTYVNGGSYSGATTANKVHVYDLRLSLGSMYINSISVGLAGDTHVTLNHFCMNGTRYREAPNVFY